MVCTEVLSSLLYRAKRNQLMSCLKLTRAALMITYLLFANDSIIFSWGNSQDFHAILNVLNLYKNASGQMVNFNKSSLFFIANVKKQDRGLIMEICNINTVAFSEKHLRLPTMIGRSKNG